MTLGRFTYSIRPMARDLRIALAVNRQERAALRRAARAARIPLSEYMRRVLLAAAELQALEEAS